MYPSRNLKTPRIAPAVAFGSEEWRDLIVYGGYDAEGIFVDIAEIFSLKNDMSREIVQIGFAKFISTDHIHLSSMKIFFPSRVSEKLYIVHQFYQTNDPEPNDLNENFWHKLSSQSVTFEAMAAKLD